MTGKNLNKFKISNTYNSIGMGKKFGWKKIRKFFNDVHLWLGLSSGLIIIAVCFSGTIYVFNTELIEWSAPHLYKVSPVPGQTRLSPDSVLDKVAIASGGKVTSISIPENLDKPYQINVRKEGDKSKGGIGYLVNPYTGEILGNTREPSGMRTFMSYMFSLHRWLLLDKIEEPVFKGKSNLELGRLITGTATIIFTLGCITGIIIWFPNRLKSWRQGLKIKWDAGWKRRNHDLHNSLAFYALVFLLLMGLTGPQWSFQWYRTGLQKTLGTYKEKVQKENKIEKKEVVSLVNNEQRISVSECLKIADESLPFKGNYLVSLPDRNDRSIVVSKTRVGFFAPAAADRLTLDIQNGKVLKKDIFSQKPLNERIAGSIKAIHVGNVYGTFTKWIYFLACLIATSLPVTGTMIWINKFKKRRKKSITIQQKKLQYA